MTYCITERLIVEPLSKDDPDNFIDEDTSLISTSWPTAVVARNFKDTTIMSTILFCIYHCCPE